MSIVYVGYMFSNIHPIKILLQIELTIARTHTYLNT